eukprot:scaffold1006_cov270-Pinguiococcus_pyrenoidosus.AAC.2
MGFLNGPSDTLAKCVRSMLLHSGSPRRFWPYAVKYATFIANRSGHSALGKSPYEAALGAAPKLDNLRVWGCVVYRRSCSASPAATIPRSRTGRTAPSTRSLPPSPTLRKKRVPPPLISSSSRRQSCAIRPSPVQDLLCTTRAG